jgi:hypothetical protein
VSETEGYVLRIRAGEGLKEIAIDTFEIEESGVLMAKVGTHSYWFSPSEWMSVRDKNAPAETGTM